MLRCFMSKILKQRNVSRKQRYRTNFFREILIFFIREKKTVKYFVNENIVSNYEVMFMTNRGAS